MTHVSHGTALVTVRIERHRRRLPPIGSPNAVMICCSSRATRARMEALAARPARRDRPGDRGSCRPTSPPRPIFAALESRLATDASHHAPLE